MEKLNKGQIENDARIYIKFTNHDNTLHPERQQGMYDGYVFASELIIPEKNKEIVELESKLSEADREIENYRTLNHDLQEDLVKAEREIESLKAELSKERDFNHVAENHLGNANNAWQDSYKILQQKYDALKEKHDGLEKDLSQISDIVNFETPFGKERYNDPLFKIYEILNFNIQKEAKDGE